MSPATAHRSPKRHTDADAAAEPDFDGWHHAAGGWTFCTQRAHEHPAPLLRSIVDAADTPRGVGSPSRLSKRIYDESDQTVDTPGDSRVPA